MSLLIRYVAVPGSPNAELEFDVSGGGGTVSLEVHHDKCGPSGEDRFSAFVFCGTPQQFEEFADIIEFFRLSLRVEGKP